MDDQPTPSEGRESGPPQPPAPVRDTASSATQRIEVIIEAAEKAAAGIIEDAEAQARQYLEESRRRADQLAEERVTSMSDLTDSLIRQAQAVKRQSDDLIASLDQARAQLERDEPAARVQPPPPPPPPPAREPAVAERNVPHLQPVEPEPVEQPPPPAPEPPPVPSRPPLQQPPQRPAEPQPQQSEPPFVYPPRATARPAPAPPQRSQQPVQPQRRPESGGGASDGARLLATQMAVAGSSRAEIERRLHNEFGIKDAGPILDGVLGPDS